MAGRTLDLDSLVNPDQLGSEIARNWITWDTARQTRIKDWEEVRQYVFATDTRKTSNASLPWKNSTTIPKLCQIRDNLYANYSAAMFPKRHWLTWEGSDESSNGKSKREAIENYMSWVIDQDRFKKEVDKLVLDYIDYGNAFATVDWVDETQQLEDKTKVGYIGPVVKRISPLDIVMNPTAPSFEEAPKIIRSLISMGEVKEILTRFSKPDTADQYQALWDYLKGVRLQSKNFTGVAEKSKDDVYRIQGFGTYREYLASGYCELLTFYGDIYDEHSDEYLRNQVIVVADRCKVIHKAPNPSYFGHPPIYHVGWRGTQDNLWAMGPLDNLVGMQYRIDHVENLKADVFDLITFPPIKVKGYVEDFEWGPGKRIYVGDDGDVEMMAPPFQVLQANSEIASLEMKMEEMAGAPKEAMGFRTPGEKTAYEVQRIESAASRVFTNKISRFEEQMVERILNAQLELTRRNFINEAMTIRVFDDEFKMAEFKTLAPSDIAGNGRIRPVAARHFAEKAEKIQNLNNMLSSPVGQDQQVMVHISGLKIAEMLEDLLDLEDYDLITPYVRLTEQADAQRLAQSAQEQVAMESQTPSGISGDDVDPGMMPPGMPVG
jgi:hypothetical protein